MATDDLPHTLVKKGFERSTHWMHIIGAIAVFTTDVFKPLLGKIPTWFLVICIICSLLCWALIRYRVIRHERITAAFTFFLVTIGLSSVAYATEEIAGVSEHGVLADLFPQISALQKELGLIHNEIKTIKYTVEKNGKDIKEIKDAVIHKKTQPSAISLHISGFWGEDDCTKLTYKFSYTDTSITINSDKVPTSDPKYHFVGTIIKENGKTMEVRGEEPNTAKGTSATFRYESNGATERLYWQDHVAGGTSVELNRCGGKTL